MPWPITSRSTWSTFLRSPFNPSTLVSPTPTVLPSSSSSTGQSYPLTTIQTLAPYYRAFPDLDISQIDRYAHSRCGVYSTTWTPEVLPFVPDSLPRLPPISQNALDRLWTEPALAELLSPGDVEARSRDSWKAYDGVGDRLINAAALAAVNRARERGINSPNASHLLQNTTLSYLAYSYRLHYGYRSVSNTTEPRQKAFADMFEAYVGAVHLEHNVRGLESPVTAYLADLFHPDHWPNWTTISPSKNYLGKGLRPKRKLLPSQALDDASSLVPRPALTPISSVASMSVVRGKRNLRLPRRPERSFIIVDIPRTPPADPSQGVIPRVKRVTIRTKVFPMDTGVGGVEDSSARRQEAKAQPPALPLVVSRFTPIPPRPPRMSR